MRRRPDRFVLHFAVLFLCVLLAMLALFLYMRAHHGRPIEGGTLNFTRAFRINLFLINLSLLVVLESLLIFIFVRFTVPAVVISSVAILALVATRPQWFDRGVITRLFVPLVRSPYAALGLSDAVLLFLLNALLLAFMISMMQHHHRLDVREEAAAALLVKAPEAELPTPNPGPEQGPAAEPPCDDLANEADREA